MSGPITGSPNLGRQAVTQCAIRLLIPVSRAVRHRRFTSDRVTGSMTQKRLAACSVAALLAGLLVIPPARADTSPTSRSEARLARALEGRVSGKPVDCLNQRDIRSSQIIDRTAILYETSGGTLYLNRPDAGQSSLRRGDVLVTDTHSHRLCSIDVVHLYDTASWMPTGVVFLGEFVPYRKLRARR